MGSAARLEALSTALGNRRAAIEARLQVDQERLVGSLRGVARVLVPEVSPDRVQDLAEILEDPELLDVLDDLERSAEADRTRLRAVSVHEHLREPARRVSALDRRLADARSRVAQHRSELERLDIDAFRWLKARNLQRSRKQGPSERFWRAVTFATLREQHAEAALRESLGHEGFAEAEAAYGQAEKGLRRAADEAERLAHTRAFIQDLILEFEELTERVGTEPSRRLRSVQAAAEARLISTDLSGVVPRAPPEVRPALSQAHALEIRLRGWRDLEAALDTALADLDWVQRHLYSGEHAEAVEARLARQEALPEAVDKVVDVLAAFHDFERWQAALEAGESPPCWTVLSGAKAGCLDRELLMRLIPRLMQRPVCARGPSSQLE